MYKAGFECQGPGITQQQYNSNSAETADGRRPLLLDQWKQITRTCKGTNVASTINGTMLLVEAVGSNTI